MNVEKEQSEIELLKNRIAEFCDEKIKHYSIEQKHPMLPPPYKEEINLLQEMKQYLLSLP